MRPAKAALAQRGDERSNERRLARAADGDVADDDNRHRQARAAQHAAAIDRAPQRGAGTEQQRQRHAVPGTAGRQRRIPAATRLSNVARESAHLRGAFGGACVANVMWMMPAARAASITWMTD